MRDHKAQSREFFDKLASRYDRHYYGSHGRWLYPRVAAAASAWRCGSVLDVGCGTGSLLTWFKRAKVKLAGADLSPKMIQEAKKRLGKSVDLRVADSEDLPWKANTFDLVVCTDSFHHYPNPEAALPEMKRVLRKTGHVIIGDVWAPFPLRQIGNWLARFGKEGDVKIYSETEFRQMIGKVGFVDIQLTARSFTAILIHAKVGK